MFRSGGLSLTACEMGQRGPLGAARPGRSVCIACTGHGGQIKFPSRPARGWAAGAGSLGGSSLEATSGLASQCRFLLETEVGSPEVGTGWFRGASPEPAEGPLLPPMPPTLRTPSLGTGRRVGEGTAGTGRRPSAWTREEMGRGEKRRRSGLWEPRRGSGRLGQGESVPLSGFLSGSLFSPRPHRPPAPPFPRPLSLPWVFVPGLRAHSARAGQARSPWAHGVRRAPAGPARRQDGEGGEGGARGGRGGDGLGARETGARGTPRGPGKGREAATVRKVPWAPPQAEAGAQPARPALRTRGRSNARGVPGGSPGGRAWRRRRRRPQTPRAWRAARATPPCSRPHARLDGAWHPCAPVRRPGPGPGPLR